MRYTALLLYVTLAAYQLLIAVGGNQDFFSLSWNVTAETKGGKKLLQQVFGFARPGRIHALLGPSGSGKTTLLNSLAAQIPKGSILLSGSVEVSQEFEPLFIEQDSILFAQLTSKETLQISYDLRKEGLESDRDESVNRMLNILGLKKVANTKVGDAKTRGLSGGEKKRLDIGNEIIDSDVAVNYLFADEPTSGLDCFQAERVVNLLRGIAEKGSTVMFSIHQPRASIYELFQDITLLSEGRVIYSGSKDDMVSYFTRLGYPLPTNVSPAEFYVDLVSVDYSSTQEESKSRARIYSLADQFATIKGEEFISNKIIESLDRHKTRAAIVPTKRPGLLSSLKMRIGSSFHNLGRAWKKFTILHGRAWKQVTRDKPLNIARFASSIFSALLFGVIYFKMGKGAATAADRLGLLQVAAVNCAMTSLIKATTSFVTEKLVIQKERRRGSYGVIPYFLAKMIAEIPLSSFYPCLFGLITYKMCGLNEGPGKLLSFLSVLVMEAIASTSFGMSVGSLVPSVEAGVAVAPAVMVIFIVFGGLYVVNAPSYLQWVPKISLIRWAFEGLCVNEFTGLKMIPDNLNPGIGGVFPGEKVLERMGMTNSVKQTLLAQAGITLFNYAFTCLVLRFQTSGKNTIDLSKKTLTNSNRETSLSNSGNGEKPFIITSPRI